MTRTMALLLTFAPALALADPAEEFLALDLTGDGLVSLAEAAGFANVVVRFDRADRNRDGRLSLYEFQRLKTMRMPVHDKALAARSAGVGATRRR